MSIPVPNMDKAEAWEATGGLLEPGQHLVKITSAVEGTSSGGYPQLELQLTDNSGQGIKDWLVVIEKTFGKVVQMLQAAGVPVPSGDDAQLHPEPLVGKKVTITVSEEADNKGGSRNRVVAYEPASAYADDGTAVDTTGMNGTGSPSQKRDGSIPF